MHNSFYMRKFCRALLPYFIKHLRVVGYNDRFNALANNMRSEDFFISKGFNGAAAIINILGVYVLINGQRNLSLIYKFDIIRSKSRHILYQPMEVVETYRPNRRVSFIDARFDVFA